MGRTVPQYTKNYRSSLEYDPKTGKTYDRNGNELDKNDLPITKEKKINTKEKILLWLDFYIFSRFRK